MGISNQPACSTEAFARTVDALQRSTEPRLYDAFLRALAADTRAAVEKPSAFGAWVPLDHWTSMLDVAHEVTMDGDHNRLTTLSERSLEAPLRKLFHRTARMSTPLFALTHAIKLWDKYTLHSGRVEPMHVSDTACDVAFLDVPAAKSTTFLPFVRGIAQAVLRASGQAKFAVEPLPSDSWQRRTLRAGWQA